MILPFKRTKPPTIELRFIDQFTCQKFKSHSPIDSKPSFGFHRFAPMLSPIILSNQMSLISSWYLTYTAQSAETLAEKIEIYGIYVMRAFDSQCKKECVYYSMHDRISYILVRTIHTLCFFIQQFSILSDRGHARAPKTPAKLFAWYNQWSKSCLLALKAKMSNTLHMCLCHRINEATIYR